MVELVGGQPNHEVRREALEASIENDPVYGSQGLAQSKEALQEAEILNRAIEKQVAHLDQIKTWADTVQSNGAKISERALKMRAELETDVGELDRCIASLRSDNRAA